MRKYFTIALGLTIFAITPVPARTIHQSATQSTQKSTYFRNPAFTRCNDPRGDSR